MAFPTTGILDNFNRTDEEPVTNWTDLVHGVEIISNELSADIDNDEAIAMYDVATYGPDCEAYHTIAVMAQYCDAVFARMTTLTWATTDGYVGYYSPSSSEIRIYRVDNGGYTQLGSNQSYGLVAGDKIGIECIGSAIKIYIDDGGAGWSEEHSATDATHGSAGYFGVRFQTISANVGKIDDFGGGTVVAGGEEHEKALADSITLADVGIKSYGLVKADGMTLADGIAKSVNQAKADGITLADGIANVASFLRTFSDDITLSDTETKSIGIALDDSVTLSEELSALIAFLITLSDSITLTDSMTKTAGLVRADGITLSDLRSHVTSFLRTLSDSITLADSIAKATGITKADSITITDSIVKNFGLVKADSVTLSDDIAKSIGMVVADTITLSDSIDTGVTLLAFIIEQLGLNPIKGIY